MKSLLCLLLVACTPAPYLVAKGKPKPTTPYPPPKCRTERVRFMGEWTWRTECGPKG